MCPGHAIARMIHDAMTGKVHCQEVEVVEPAEEEG